MQHRYHAVAGKNFRELPQVAQFMTRRADQQHHVTANQHSADRRVEHEDMVHRLPH